jgi:K+-transporting ATPase A subunit
LFVVIITALVKPLGGYMERVFSSQRTLLDRFCLPVERLIYRITAVDPNGSAHCAVLRKKRDDSAILAPGVTPDSR